MGEPILNEPLWEIVEQSAFLEERLGGDFLPTTRAQDSEVMDQRMAAWRRNCAKGDEKVFLKRLQWDGMDVGRARSLVGRVRWVKAGDLPPWARWLRPMIESSQEAWDESLLKNDLASIRGEQPAAFEELFYPFLRLAREALQKEAGAAYSLLAEAAHRQWERWLLRSLEAIAASTLDLEFTGFRSVNLQLADGTHYRQLYESFLNSLKGEGLLQSLSEIPGAGEIPGQRTRAVGGGG